jgi:hypothetical protein
LRSFHVSLEPISIDDGRFRMGCTMICSKNNAENWATVSDD